MKLLAPTILALASSTPGTSADAFSLGGGPYFTKQIYLTNPASMMQRQRALANRFLFDQQNTMASPRYELVDNDEKFQLSVDVPGVKMEDIDVSLEDGYLTVSGQRLSSNENSRFASKFSQSFSLDPAVDVEKFSANLDNGVLVVAAPKDMKRIEENVVRIPIVQGKSLDDDSKVEVEKPSFADDADGETMDLDKAGASA